MSRTLSRRLVRQQLEEILAEPKSVAEAIGDAPLPETLRSWLARLVLLSGVPFSYLVPHEAMLPPESIRFFHLDMNWIDALHDGALSVGLNPGDAAQRSTASRVDAAVRPALRAHVNSYAFGMRARGFGAVAPVGSLKTVTGFLLRSSVVAHYPGMGVAAYATVWDPPQPAPKTLDLLRVERLGPRADVLLCLVDGLVAQIDLHEPPEHLHYGIDEYSVGAGGKVTASKVVFPFDRQAGADGDTVSFKTQSTKLDLGGCFRARAPRTFKLASLAALLDARNAAEMGFAMTEGVGLVSFRKSTGA